MEQILISENSNATAQFDRELKDVLERTQSLIDAYHAFQSFERIETLQDLFDLLQDPAGEYDRVIIGATEMKAGNLQPNPEQVALMFNLDRDKYMSLVSGRTTGKKAISLTAFRQFEDYLLFEGGQLSLNQEAIEVKKKSFAIYATSPEQIEVYRYWNTVCATLNGLRERGHLNQASMLTLQDSMQRRVMFSYATGQLHLNEEILINEILKLKIE